MSATRNDNDAIRHKRKAAAISKIITTILTAQILTAEKWLSLLKNAMPMPFKTLSKKKPPSETEAFSILESPVRSKKPQNNTKKFSARISSKNLTRTQLSDIDIPVTIQGKKRKRKAEHNSKSPTEDLNARKKVLITIYMKCRDQEPDTLIELNFAELKEIINSMKGFAAINNSLQDQPSDRPLKRPRITSDTSPDTSSDTSARIEAFFQSNKLMCFAYLVKKLEDSNLTEEKRSLVKNKPEFAIPFILQDIATSTPEDFFKSHPIMCNAYVINKFPAELRSGLLNNPQLTIPYILEDMANSQYPIVAQLQQMIQNQQMQMQTQPMTVENPKPPVLEKKSEFSSTASMFNSLNVAPQIQQPQVIMTDDAPVESPQRQSPPAIKGDHNAMLTVPTSPKHQVNEFFEFKPDPDLFTQWAGFK